MTLTSADTMSDQLDAETIDVIRRGDPERYRELIERYERQVFAVAWCRLGDTDLAEEATQEAFIKGFRHLPFLSHGEKFAAWITAIARNAAINLGLRRRRELNKRERWGLDYAESLAPATDASPHDEEPRPAQTLRAALALLPAQHRECLVLFLVILTLRNAPSRKDYNLFLRQVMGMIPDPVSAPTLNRAVPRRLSRAEILAFGRFLGDRWLVNDFRKGTDGFLFRLPASRLRLSPMVSPVFWGMPAFFWGKNSSQLHVSWDGSVSARVGRKDFADLSERADLRDLCREDLERRVSRGVEKALGCFLAGETEVAEKWVGQVPEADIFLVPPRQSAATRWRIVVLAGLGIAAIVSSVLLPRRFRKSKNLAMELTRHRRPESNRQTGVRGRNSASSSRPRVVSIGPKGGSDPDDGRTEGRLLRLRVSSAAGRVGSSQGSPRWKFARPGRLISQRGGEGGQVLSDDELMGWFYQQRFDRFIAARKTDPKRSAPSLQTP